MTEDNDKGPSLADERPSGILSEAPAIIDAPLAVVLAMGRYFLGALRFSGVEPHRTPSGLDPAFDIQVAAQPHGSGMQIQHGATPPLLLAGLAALPLNGMPVVVWLASEFPPAERQALTEAYQKAVQLLQQLRGGVHAGQVALAPAGALGSIDAQLGRGRPRGRG